MLHNFNNISSLHNFYNKKSYVLVVSKNFTCASFVMYHIVNEIASV